MERYWGSSDDLDPLQMAVRAAVMFFVLLAMIRLAGSRLLGKKTGFDTAVLILMGAVAARGVVGASRFTSTVAACAVVVLLHRVVAHLAARLVRVTRLFEGRRVCLYRDGEIQRANLLQASVSEKELMASLRLETRQDSFEGIDEAYLETNGRISFVERREVGGKAKLGASDSGQ
jgi:uncharacterized membrane protein YcaP (DUF421 family)